MAKLPKNVRSYLTRLARKANQARNRKLTPAQRRAIAQKAARDRWAKRVSPEGETRRSGPQLIARDRGRLTARKPGRLIR